MVIISLTDYEPFPKKAWDPRGQWYRRRSGECGMVDLQKEDSPLQMKSRMRYRKELEFDSERTLTFEKRTVKDLCNRDYYFKSFRRLHYDIIVEGAKNRVGQAKELNIKGVGYYKEGKWQEALWCFEKALSIDPKNKNAKKNLTALNKKLKDRKVKKSALAKEGKSFKEITRQQRSDDARAGYDQGQQPAYQPTSAQPAYQQSSYQQPRTGSYDQQWRRNYRCPYCGIPVRENWLMCTNCGTDLRRYPPTQY
jgi:tetratricopeptide (TPR) repeat protein